MKVISYGNVPHEPFNIPAGTDCRYDCLRLQPMHANVMLNVKCGSPGRDLNPPIFFSFCSLI